MVKCIVVVRYSLGQSDVEKMTTENSHEIYKIYY